MCPTQREYETNYGKATAPEQLPWHRETIPPLLAKTANLHPQGKALDVGCGTGVFATYLAAQGLAVTAIDFVDRALEFTRQRGDRLGLSLEILKADVTDWQSEEPFDLVFDSGCLHSLSNLEQRQAYKRNLLTWLAPEGDYVLGHFYKRNFLDWRPVGPRRYTRQQLDNFFAPELKEQEFQTEELTNLPFPVGPTARMGYYRFRHSQSNR